MRIYFHPNCRLYRERLNQINVKLEEMTAGRSIEYLERLRQLQEQMQVRTQVAGGFTHCFLMNNFYIFVKILANCILVFRYVPKQHVKIKHYDTRFISSQVFVNTLTKSFLIA